jgi:hypothetical protein
MRDHRNATRKTVVEVRWFVDGDVGYDLVDGRPPDKRRVDSYHIHSLTESSAWKRRGRHRRLEHKWRIGAPSPVVVAGITGSAERWGKRHSWTRPVLGGPWIEVAKEIWTEAGCEITRLHVDRTVSWTVSVKLHKRSLTPSTIAVLERWLPLLRSDGLNASYPSWLITRRDRSRSRALLTSAVGV